MQTGWTFAEWMDTPAYVKRYFSDLLVIKRRCENARTSRG